MHRLNHHHLYIFWTLSKAGTFTQAAKELSIAQSAVTLQIKQLEDSIGLSLLDRSNGRKPELTGDGRRVLEYADAIFEASQELTKWAMRGEAPVTSVIKVGSISGLSRNLQYEFLKPLVLNPKVKIEVITGDQDNLVRQLKEHTIDVVLSSHNIQSEGRAPFYSHVLITSPVVLVVKSDPQIVRKPDFKALLAQKPLYVPGLNFEIRPELDAYLEGLKCPYRIAGEIDDIALLRIFALRSGAIVALPEMGVKNEIESKELIVLSRAKGIEQRFYAITRQRRVPNSMIEMLIKKMRS